PTSKTTMRGPFASRAALNEPGPSGASVVTRMILPPRPPGVAAAGPTAPGKAPPAGSAAGAGLADKIGAIMSAANNSFFSIESLPHHASRRGLDIGRDILQSFLTPVT